MEESIKRRNQSGRWGEILKDLVRSDVIKIENQNEDSSKHVRVQEPIYGGGNRRVKLK